MSQYRIFETDNFIRIMEKIRGKDKLFIENKLKTKAYPQLKEEPHYENNIKKLKNYNPET